MFNYFKENFSTPLKRNVEFFHPHSNRSSNILTPLTSRPPPTAGLKMTKPLPTISYTREGYTECADRDARANIYKICLISTYLLSRALRFRICKRLVTIFTQCLVSSLWSNLQFKAYMLSAKYGTTGHVNDPAYEIYKLWIFTIFARTIFRAVLKSAHLGVREK